MNPVEIWEGIDTGEETGRNCLTKLAIHILSIVANSAGCERAFSHMGLVHIEVHGVNETSPLRLGLRTRRKMIRHQKQMILVILMWCGFGK